MSNDIYQQRQFFEPHSICVERDEEGRCLMSVRFIMFDLGEVSEPNVVQLFCDQVKDKEK